MPSLFDQYENYRSLVAEANHLSKSLVLGLRMGLGFSSSWEGKSIGRYIERKGEALTVSGPFPLDLSKGFLIEPRTNLLDGSSPIRTRFDNVEALVLVITGYGWQLPEVSHRMFFHSWARQIDGPVFVSLVGGRGAWASTSWIFTAGDCIRHGTFPGECEKYSNAS